MMTSTAKIIAAIGALNIAASDAAAAQAMRSLLLLKLRLVREAISDPMVELDWTAGASNPPEPPNPTLRMLVTIGAKSQVLLRAPFLVDRACRVAGIPPPGWSPPSTLFTNK